MHTRTRLTTAIATGVVATALLASPSLAAGQRGGVAADQTAPAPQTSQAAGTCDGTGTGAGAGQGARSGRRGDAGRGVAGQSRASGQDRTAGQGRTAEQDRTAGQGRIGQGRTGQGQRAGTGADLTDVDSGTLTEDQKLALSSIAEDEKLAHDLYVAFADTFDARAFTRIATAETRHLAEVRIVLDRYDIADPTIGLDAGTFATASFQDLYDTQLAAGSASLEAAYAAGELIETTDIDALKDATVGVTAPDVLRVYTNLLAGSEHHLAAFTR